MAMEGAKPFLPQEIITHILKFLPVKSLIRFQCVCKRWKNLIKTPSFIAAHLHHSNKHRPSLLFHQHRLKLHLLNGEMEIAKVHNAPVVDDLVWIAGSCNGLLCLRIDRYGNVNGIYPPRFLLLWNPAFKEVRKVPTALPDIDGDCHIGFGFSPIVDDYKIVTLYITRYGSQVHLVQVYSLGLGSWKQVEVGNLEGTILMGGAGFTMNGAIFWLGYKLDAGEGREYVMISFDIATEVFELIPVPDLDHKFGVHVTEFEHRPAILCSTLIANSVSCLIDLWVLEEGPSGSGERWSWAKKYAGRPSQGLFRPVTIWRNEIVCTCHLMPGDEGTSIVERTVLSNLTSTELKVLFDLGHFIFNYVESLVPVSNIRIEEP